MSRLSGVVTPSFAAVLKRLQADHARPGGSLEEGADDQRNPEQRFHDAVEAAVNGGFQPGGELQPARGTTSVVTVAHIADVAALAGVSLPEGEDFVLPGSGKAVSDAGVRISISQAVQQMVDRNSFLQVLGNEGLWSIPQAGDFAAVSGPSWRGRRFLRAGHGHSGSYVRCSPCAVVGFRWWH